MQSDNSNTYFQLAAELVNYTDRHVFLTGKAGTGKTTFLKYIKEHSPKNAVVVAPTGVAAINAGGVTMHSFFQLPFSPYLPLRSNGFEMGEMNYTDRYTLLKNIRFNKDKIELIQELELLVIDEVSMLRCDMLDAIDTILRHFRKKDTVPFGGVQVLYIGDLLQLPPVVKDDEWQMMQQYYNSPFFFDALVLRESAPLYVELQKIYRQTEQEFIDILNRVRNNEVTPRDLHVLNNRYQPDPTAGDSRYITLTTHNHKADAVNMQELRRIGGKEHVFKGQIEGEFSDKNLPVEIELQLKVGAQVMFIKNDVGNERRFFNGKLATVKRISGDEIVVASPDNIHEELVLEKETWENVRYKFNKETNAVEEEVIGSYKQYPVRLAWAITIHKSQGLTFQQAVIDAGASFAAGQVYVALSRCTSLDGIVLLSKITERNIHTDERIANYLRQYVDEDRLQQIVRQEKKRYLGNQLLKAFDLRKVINAVQELRELVLNKKAVDKVAGMRLCEQLIAKTEALATVANKFIPVLAGLVQQAEDTIHTAPLIERTQNAVRYFTKELHDAILMPLSAYIEETEQQKKVKQYLKVLYEIENDIWSYQLKLQQLSYEGIALCNDVFVRKERKQAATTATAKKEKKEAGASLNETLALFKNKKTVAEIATARQLAVSTIEAHLNLLVKTGEIPLRDVIPEYKARTILKAITELEPDAGITAVKQQLGDDFSYFEIRAVMSDMQRKQAVNSTTTRH